MPAIFQNVNSVYGYVRMRVNATTLITEVWPLPEHLASCMHHRAKPLPCENTRTAALWTMVAVPACMHVMAAFVWRAESQCVCPMALRLSTCDEGCHAMQAVAIPGGNVFDTVTIVSSLPQPPTSVLLPVLLFCFRYDCRWCYWERQSNGRNLMTGCARSQLHLCSLHWAHGPGAYADQVHTWASKPQGGQGDCHQRGAGQPDSHAGTGQRQPGS